MKTDELSGLGGSTPPPSVKVMINLNQKDQRPIVGSWAYAKEFKLSTCGGIISIASVMDVSGGYRVQVLCATHGRHPMHCAVGWHLKATWYPKANLTKEDKKTIKCGCDIKMALSVANWHTCGR